MQRGEFGQLVHLRQTFVVFLRDDNALFVCSTVHALVNSLRSLYSVGYLHTVRNVLDIALIDAPRLCQLLQQERNEAFVLS